METKECFFQLHNDKCEALENIVMSLLEETELKIDHIRGHCYNGAANVGANAKRGFSQESKEEI